jgi:hypothetical protein
VDESGPNGTLPGEGALDSTMPDATMPDPTMPDDAAEDESDA